MSGKIDGTAFLLAFVAVGALWDLALRRIPNWLNLSGLALGFGFSIMAAGWSGALSSLLGVVAGVIALGWMFVFRFMGAGDVKFLMAVGAWVGPARCLEVGLLSILVGGVMAIAQIVMTGHVRKRLTRFWRFFQSVLIQELKLEPLKVDQRLRMPYGIAIAVAVVLIENGVSVWGLVGLHLK